jgi:type IV pilus assembly protein PilY1
MKTKFLLILFALALFYDTGFALTLSQVPLASNQSGTPLVMLNMERDHKLYYEAYNDASDLNRDSVIDIHYTPSIDYFGYFDSHTCYDYVSGKFSPVAQTLNKECGGVTAWSGDFLNYLTMSRIDALRKVLYGGKRSTDSTTETVLERSYIPQDAHSWGKEYTSTAVDGYDIALYSPLSQPITGRRHLFANTTLLCPPGNTDPGCNSNQGLPLLRVLNDTTFRVWEWLSIERPVAGVQCATGNNTRSNCVPPTLSFSNWEKIPAINFKDLKQATWSKSGCAAHPFNTVDFATLETCAKGKTKYGEANKAQIDGSGNPFSAVQDNYFTLFTGKITIPAGQDGTYNIGVDGDDAVEVYIDGSLVVGWYDGHGDCGNNTSCFENHDATITLSAGDHNVIFRHEEAFGGDTYYLRWQKPVVSTTAMTDFVVRVEVCKTGFHEEDCRGYPRNNPTIFKPSGILQQFGETNRMAFGLMTGSYAKNVSGGVLRKNISSITDEINDATGQFSSAVGVIKSIDALKVTGFGNSYAYDQNCGVPEVNGILTENRCRMWGNPTAEIMYEGLRYFAGKTSPTSVFTYTNAGSDDNALGLPLPAWENPYRTTTGGYPSCSKPTQMVISDINPNFDTDQIQGRFSYTLPTPLPAAFAGDISGLNVSTLADSIWNAEYGSSRSLFIGQSGANFDGAPTAKNSTSFADIRGLSPEEPTQQGGFYSGSIALFGKTNDINTAPGDQKVDTFSVALASPLPRIVFPLNGKFITLVPFAKTVGGCGSVTATQGNYQPTNTIVDFYVDTIANTGAANAKPAINGGRPYAKFRINYEDSEYGSDHDMDAIAEYELTAKSDGTVDIRASSNYAAGGCIQHMGYVISGTSSDGIYLEIRDPDTAVDVDYYLDTPNTASVALPTDTTRNFSVGTNPSAAFVDHDPLWYAAKWGGFLDSNENNVLDDSASEKEWDNRNGGDGVPDSYFLVTNAGELKAQLERAFTEILKRDGSASAAATNSTSLDSESRVYQAKFNSADWSGQLLSFRITTNADLSAIAEWDSGDLINSQDPASGRVIITKGTTDGVPFNYVNLTGPTTTVGSQQNLLDKNAAGTTDNCGLERVAYIRGDSTHEGTNGTFTCDSGSVISPFRERATSKLGDIINSNPVFVGSPSAGYADAEQPGYGAYRRAKANRKPVIYVGANDGMLHGFDVSIDTPTTPADPGKEVLAYIPSTVMANLSKLTGQTYNQNHLFFVDGSPMTADIDIDSTASIDWRTILVGAMGAGGKGYYALDITEPNNFSESNASDILLWEFDEADMGFVFNQPPVQPLRGQAKQIVKLKVNGSEKWAVIVSNGYNSPQGKAVLYVLFIENGVDGTWSASDFVKLIADAPVGLDNGLSTPVPVDSDEDGFTDIVYAGDLKGNLWKFLIGTNGSDSSVTDSTITWKVAFSTTNCAAGTPSTCIPLFKAINSSGQAQPILWPPEITQHPLGDVDSNPTNTNFSQLILLGTGKFIEFTDTTNNDVQTFYGIWDKNDGTTTVGLRNVDLLQQSLSTSPCADPPALGVACTVFNPEGDFRRPTAKTINWRSAPTNINPANCAPLATCNPSHMGWYIDLPAPRERATGVPKLLGPFIFFNTLIPSDSTCSKADGHLLFLDYASGALVNSPVIDTNGDGKIDANDTVVGGYKVGAILGGSTIISSNASTPGFSDGSGSSPGSDSSYGNAVAVSSDVTGDLKERKIKIPRDFKGRINWREILQ